MKAVFHATTHARIGHSSSLVPLLDLDMKTPIPTHFRSIARHFTSHPGPLRGMCHPPIQFAAGQEAAHLALHMYGRRFPFSPETEKTDGSKNRIARLQDQVAGKRKIAIMIAGRRLLPARDPVIWASTACLVA